MLNKLSFKEVESYTDTGIDEIGGLVYDTDNENLKKAYSSLYEAWGNFQEALTEAGFEGNW